MPRISVIEALVAPPVPIDISMLIKHHERGAVFQGVRIAARTFVSTFMAARVDGRMLLRRKCSFCFLRPVHARADA